MIYGVKVCGMVCMGRCANLGQDMKKIWFLVGLCACFAAACDDGGSGGETKAVCGNGVLEEGEECDGSVPEWMTCGLAMEGTTGTLGCTAQCTYDVSQCGKCNRNGVKEDGEECDGNDLGGATCASVDASRPYGRLGCTTMCRYTTHFCSASDLGLQAPNPDQEQTDEQCSNGLNDFGTVDKNGRPATWIDCKSHSCLMSPIVQVCQSIENTNEACSDKVDNPTAAGLPAGMKNVSNGLIDCEDPSCFKNWRVTVCEEQAPRWELGDDCKDGKDNDGDGLVDCDDPDCLHAGSPCDLGARARVLFDNAHHQIAGQADWIIDVTGRHPFPSVPAKEDDWHGSLSSWGKDLLDSGNFIVETLPQDRAFTYKDASKPQDLSQYQILVSVEPSSKYSESEILALHDFVKDGGGLMIFADHKGADRDGNNVDAIDAINDMLGKLPGASGIKSNPFGFYALETGDMKNETATPAAGAIEKIVKGVSKTGSYAGTTFEITDKTKAAEILNLADGRHYAIAVNYGKGRIIAVGDSSITGDGTNFLAITSTKAAYKEYDNRAFLINAMEWLRNP